MATHKIEILGYNRKGFPAATYATAGPPISITKRRQ
jgi:hypothetical protein